jgi:hypothetical protein
MHYHRLCRGNVSSTIQHPLFVHRLRNNWCPQNYVRFEFLRIKHWDMTLNYLRRMKLYFESVESNQRKDRANILPRYTFNLRETCCVLTPRLTNRYLTVRRDVVDNGKMSVGWVVIQNVSGKLFHTPVASLSIRRMSRYFYEAEAEYESDASQWSTNPGSSYRYLKDITPCFQLLVAKIFIG